MELCVVIPAYNEEGSIEDTIDGIVGALDMEAIPFSILIVNDNSKDNTAVVLEQLYQKDNRVKNIFNEGPNGFGYAVRCGLNNHTGDCVAIMMADLSDDPQDLISFYKVMLEKNVDCVFGSRFVKGGSTHDYPAFKLFLNRFFNNLIKLFFNIKYNDVTNAFKLYKAETVTGLKPFISPHFNLTVELPLKAIIRGFSFEVVPNSWRNRKAGESKLEIKEMGSRYFFTLLYCFIEKHFAQGDFKKPN